MDTKHTHGCCADKACTQKTCMELPAGKTCGDCHNFKHCQAFYAHTQTDTYCDFFPRRFAERVAQSTGDEREQWLPLAGELRARILHKHQFGGTVLLSLEDVLAISCELKRAERRNSMRQRIVFDEVSVRGVYTWRDENGKKRQETRKFWQTVNPFNCNEDGSVKTREQIYAELNAERDEWLREKRQS